MSKPHVQVVSNFPIKINENLAASQKKTGIQLTCIDARALGELLKIIGLRGIEANPTTATNAKR
jgi:hypothetical protein